MRRILPIVVGIVFAFFGARLAPVFVRAYVHRVNPDPTSRPPAKSAVGIPSAPRPKPRPAVPRKTLPDPRLSEFQPSEVSLTELRVKEPLKISLRLTDYNDEEDYLPKQPPQMDYTAKLSCLGCDVIPDQAERRTRAGEAEWEWTIAPRQMGSITVHAVVVEQGSGSTQSRMRSFTVLDEYGFKESTHTALSSAGGFIFFLGGAILTKLVDVLATRWKKDTR